MANLLNTYKIPKMNLLLIDLVKEDNSIPFLFDTGAAITVMSRSTAETFRAVKMDESVKCGNNAGLIMETSLYKVENIRLGTIIIPELTIVVVDDDALSFKIDEDDSLFQFNGLLGWDVIQHYRWSYDSKNSILELYESKSNETISKRIMKEWDNMPIIEVSYNNRIELFGFDSGHTESILGEKIYSQYEDVKEVRDDFVGVGGTSQEKVKLINCFKLYIGDKLVVIDNIPAVNRAVFPSSTANICGILGIDAIEGYSWIIDYPNRVFELQ